MTDIVKKTLKSKLREIIERAAPPEASCRDHRNKSCGIYGCLLDTTTPLPTEYREAHDLMTAVGGWFLFNNGRWEFTPLPAMHPAYKEWLAEKQNVIRRLEVSSSIGTPTATVNPVAVNPVAVTSGPLYNLGLLFRNNRETIGGTDEDTEDQVYNKAYDWVARQIRNHRLIKRLALRELLHQMRKTALACTANKDPWPEKWGFTLWKALALDDEHNLPPKRVKLFEQLSDLAGGTWLVKCDECPPRARGGVSEQGFVEQTVEQLLQLAEDTKK